MRTIQKQKKSGGEAGGKQSGFTLIEMVIGTAILAILLLGIINTYQVLATSVKAFREKTSISSLADYYMEIARNLPYSQVGTTNGNPSGSLASLASPISTTINGNPYHIYYSVNYYDDPADGTILAGTDPAPNDYKQVEVYVKNTSSGATSEFGTVISPKGLEGLASGGALYAKVFDSNGQPISGASVHITNSIINPTIDVTRTSDSSGNWIEVGLPNSVNGYHVVVTKSGYSTDQTYPISGGNPNPTKPDATISNGQVTQVSFSIDLTSNLNFQTFNQTCGAIGSVGIAVKGAKLIGTSPSILKFSNNYTSDGAGQIALSNLEWDTYTPSLTGAGQMIYGSSPIQQVNVLPNTSQTFTLILGPVTTNSMLVIVKDSSSRNPIEGAGVELQNNNPVYDTTKTTGGSVWSQSDWTGGPNQVNFTDPTKYSFDDGNIDTATLPTGVRLAKLGGTYQTAGYLISSTFDSGTNSTAYTTLTWAPTSQNPATALKFQIATNNDNATWNYLGPDGTAGTYYTTSGTSVGAANNTGRYVRYKAFLSTSNTTVTPVLSNINVNYVSGCFTPGQTMFSGLTASGNYSATVSLAGYQTQTVSSLNISGYNVLQILLSH